MKDAPRSVLIGCDQQSNIPAPQRCAIRPSITTVGVKINGKMRHLWRTVEFGAEVGKSFASKTRDQSPVGGTGS